MTTEKHTPPDMSSSNQGAEGVSLLEWSSERGGGRSLCLLPSSHQITRRAKTKQNKTKNRTAVREAACGERVTQSGTVPIRYDGEDSPF